MFRLKEYRSSSGEIWNVTICLQTNRSIEWCNQVRTERMALNPLQLYSLIVVPCFASSSMTSHMRNGEPLAPPLVSSNTPCLFSWQYHDCMEMTVSSRDKQNNNSTNKRRELAIQQTSWNTKSNWTNTTAVTNTAVATNTAYQRCHCHCQEEILVFCLGLHAIL